MKTHRIPSLDGLRAISILMVILSHLVKWKHVSLEVLGNYGALGVHIFFVLSGYLITSLLLSEYQRTGSISLRDFYIRRAFRIFPAAFVFMAVVFAFYWHQLRWYHMLAAALYVANLDFTRPWMILHLWSLSVEEQFYLLWPFVVKKWHRHRAAILVCTFCFTPLFRTLMYALRIENGLTWSLPTFADQLAIGCLLAVFSPRLPRIRGSLALVMLLVAILAPWFPATSAARTLIRLYLVRPILHVSLAGLVLHVIQVPYRALNWAPVAWIGRISYSLYLWQEVFCANENLHFGYILLVPTLLCACLSYYLVEQPMLRLREQRSHRPSVENRLAPAEAA